MLLLFCHGFCTALPGHHEGENRMLFPALVEAHPELADTIRKLMRDHSMISHLIVGLQSVIPSGTTASELASHLEGISAIMGSHFRYEERKNGVPVSRRVCQHLELLAAQPALARGAVLQAVSERDGRVELRGVLR